MSDLSSTQRAARLATYKATLDNHTKALAAALRQGDTQEVAEKAEVLTSRHEAIASLEQVPHKTKKHQQRANSYEEIADRVEQEGIDGIRDLAPVSVSNPSDGDTTDREEVTASTESGESVSEPAESDESLTASPQGGSDDHGASEGSPGSDLKAEVVFPDDSRDDLGGLDEPWARLEESVANPRESPDLYHHYGFEPAPGVLLEGPPGTGKTRLVRAFCGDHDYGLVKLAPSQISSPLVSMGASNIAHAFRLAATRDEVVVLFMDDIDNIAKSRDTSIQRTQSQEGILTQLLAEFDRLDPSDGVIVIGATNAPTEVDPALRDRRFREVVQVPLPGKQARKEILQVHLTKGEATLRAIDFEAAAEAMDGFSGHDIEEAARNAAMTAIRATESPDDPEPLRHEYVMEGIQERRRMLEHTDGELEAYLSHDREVSAQSPERSPGQKSPDNGGNGRSGTPADGPEDYEQGDSA